MRQKEKKSVLCNQSYQRCLPSTVFIPYPYFTRYSNTWNSTVVLERYDYDFSRKSHREALNSPSRSKKDRVDESPSRYALGACWRLKYTPEHSKWLRKSKQSVDSTRASLI